MASVEDFCSYCDHGQSGFNNCKLKYENTRVPDPKKGAKPVYISSQQLAADREHCSFATLDGVWVDLDGQDIIIKDTNIRIPRTDLSSLRRNLNDLGVCGKVRTEKTKPNPSVLTKRTEQQSVTL